MNVLIILKTIFVYIKDLFDLKRFGTECAPYFQTICFSIDYDYCVSNILQRIKAVNKM